MNNVLLILILNVCITSMLQPSFDSTQTTTDLVNELFTAIRMKRHDKALKLIKRHSLINIIDPKTQDTPLTAALTYRHTSLACTLLAQGADPNLTGLSWQWRPIHLAARNGDLKVMQALQQKNVQLNAQTIHGDTMLSIAHASQPPSIVRQICLITGICTTR